jgi:hypothetical protein
MMDVVSRVRPFAMLLARGLVLLGGLWVIYHYSLEAFGGREKLWLFQKMEEHRYTAQAMLTGTLKLRNGLSKIGHDEQVYNGAGYTAWGFGVPLMQLPFHALASKVLSLQQKFFPDRAIYFAYFMAMVPIVWVGFDRLLAMREPPGASKLRRHFLAWAATLFVLARAFYPLMSCRFIVYEETVCYFMLAEFLALTAYVFTTESSSPWALAGLGVAAGLGLLIRATGLVYLGMWVVMLLLEHRRRRPLLAFAAGLLPLLSFWVVSNWIKTGSPVGIGLNNALPWFDYHTYMQRFGSACADTPRHAAQAAGRLFNAFFVTVTEDPKSWPWLDKCHFKFEDRPPPDGGCYSHEPFFGIAVFALLAWMLFHKLRRRESRLALYAPTAVIVLLFGTFVWAGAGFAWRYAGDFWPLFVLATVQYVRFLPRTATPLLGLPLAFAMVAGSAATYMRDIEPSVTTLQTLDEPSANKMWDDFSNSRWNQDKPLSSHVKCGERADWLYHNGEGWLDQCRVDNFTNLYLGVPDKSDDHYQLQFKTEGVSSPVLRVYLNGRIYKATRVADGYVADVNIHFASLTSPIIMTTIEWTRELDPPPYKLLSVELI